MRLAPILLLLAVILPANAVAQICSNKQPIQCDQTILGDNGDVTGTGSPLIHTYCGIHVCFAPETPWEITLTQQTTMTVTVDPLGWDATVAVIADHSFFECDPTTCYAYVDDNYGSGDEILTVTLGPGTYYIAVDGKDIFDFDPYWLTVDCGGVVLCVDDDGDGYDGYDAVSCPGGDDCCDYGTEPSLGCSSATDASINPGAEEICEDGIDQDCDGSDLVCPEEFCQADAALTCGDQIAGDNTAGNSNVSSYPGLSHPHLAPEYVYTLSTIEDLHVTATLTVDAPDPPDLALLVIEEDLNGDCRPDNLIVSSDLVQDSGNNPSEVVVFPATANTVYYIVVDGWQTDSTGGYQLAVDCQVQCPDGLTECDGECVDLNTDVNNCGQCGNVCEFPHAAASCVDGQCVMGPCDEGWYDCNLLPEDGCETDLVADNLNCGACGNECLGDQYCMGGKCVQDCPDGFMDCGGGCIDIYGDDVNHCGGCDIVCQVANGTPACESGECVILACDDGFADCLNGYSDGCETVLGTDQNCSGCGDNCDYPNGYGICVDGLCQLGACAPGYGDCNDDESDGCETELGTDQNCSACGDACEYPNASGSCQEGTCQMGDCDDGFGDCNQSPDDGCEVDLLTDASHCGTCDSACQPDEICVAGECVFCVDEDGDGYHDQACGGDDCDDSDDSIHPDAEEICHDGIDQDCDGDDTCGCEDSDGDGHLDESCGGEDCDDSNGFIHPGAHDACGDGIDQDCSGEDLPCDCADADSDGHQSNACGGDDCNDNNHFIYPGASDSCGDGIDQDCDGQDAQCADGCGCHSRTGSPIPTLLALFALLLVLRRPD